MKAPNSVPNTLIESYALRNIMQIGRQPITFLSVHNPNSLPNTKKTYSM